GDALLHVRVVHAGGRDERPEPEDRHDGDREQQLAPQVWRPESPAESAEHPILLARRCGISCRRQGTGEMCRRGPDHNGAARPCRILRCSRAPGDHVRSGKYSREHTGPAALTRRRPCQLSQASETVPPAARIFSLADAETRSTAISSLTSISPLPSTFTGWPLRTAPFATRPSTVTVPPSGNSADSLSRFTTWYSVRKGFLNPRSFGRRMCRGICPPSKPAGTWYRAFVPLVPRPAVLPFEASPRPTRVFAVLAPGAGRRWWTFSGLFSAMITRPPRR